MNHPDSAPAKLTKTPDRLPMTKYVAQTPRERRQSVSPQRLAHFIYSAEGREAVLRLLQYSLRLTVHLRRSKASSTLFNRILAVVSFLSALRRISAASELILALNYLHRSQFPPAITKDRGTPTANGSRLDLSVQMAFHVTRAGLDVISTLADNVFLFWRLRPLSISRRTATIADRIADYCMFLSSTLGLVQVSRSRQQVWAEGRAVRRVVIDLEDRLDQAVFWEASSSPPNPSERVDPLNSGNEQVAKIEERRLRDRIRAERRKLKSLRDELSELWWERSRLMADLVFSAFDVLGVEAGSDTARSWAGIFSSGISFVQWAKSP